MGFRGIITEAISMKVSRLVRFGAGLPNLIGILAAVGLGSLALKYFSESRRPRILAALDFLSGVITILTGIWLARKLGFEHFYWVPVVTVFWFSIHFLPRRGTLQFAFASCGILLGWCGFLCLSGGGNGLYTLPNELATSMQTLPTVLLR